MSKAGDIVENPITGERAVARVGTEESGGELLEVDLYVRPGGAVVGEHVHPVIEEAFTVVRGRSGEGSHNGNHALANRPLVTGVEASSTKRLTPPDAEAANAVIAPQLQRALAGLLQGLPNRWFLRCLFPKGNGV